MGWSAGERLLPELVPHSIGPLIKHYVDTQNWHDEGFLDNLGRTDICSTSFYKSVPVIQFVAEFLRVTNPLQPFLDRDRLKIKKALHGVRVETTHQQGKRSIYKILGLLLSHWHS